ncbi:hypothetical protein ACODNH_02335 (plasmid) [Haloarcula sp. NS06]|uniref:helix-turn-helix domain-containing protein n=1 Tax=Haloarcula sp. NS06 TaxID=3409688 RepID=UPI003DA71814
MQRVSREHPNCSYETEYEVIEDGTESLLVYAYTSGGRYCHSVPHLVTRTIGEGPLFDARRRRNVYEWRVLLPGDASGGEIFDRLQDGLPSGVSLSLKQAGAPSLWSTVDVSQTALSPDQRHAIETAVELGYYETPRGYHSARSQTNSASQSRRFDTVSAMRSSG